VKPSLISFLDELSKQTEYYIVDERVYVMKKYASELGLFKWFLITTSNLAVRKYPFEQDPSERLRREVGFLQYSEGCFNKPRIILVDYSSNVLIREFVKGDIYSYDAPRVIHYRLGRELGACHEGGWVLGDSKISNFVYTTDNYIYIIDAEQAIREYNDEYAAWDLLVYTSTLTMDGYLKALYNKDIYDEILESVLTGYLDGNTSAKRVFKRLLSLDYKSLIYLLVPFPFNYIFTKKIENYAD
jgi:tRNA A-37 threonylcarbamoyl transferase component Bud32